MREWAECSNPEKRREWHREYQREWALKKAKEKNPNAKHHSFYDFETHRELAINSGIQSQREWFECFKLELMPDGIYQNPNKVFRRK